MHACHIRLPGGIVAGERKGGWKGGTRYGSHTQASFLLVAQVAVAIFNFSYMFPPATLVSRLSFFFKTLFVLGSLLVIPSDFRLAAHAFNHCTFS